MPDFYVCAYSKSLQRAREYYANARLAYPHAPFELWEIEPDMYGNKYVVICREPARGRTPKIVFKKRILP